MKKNKLILKSICILLFATLTIVFIIYFKNNTVELGGYAERADFNEDVSVSITYKKIYKFVGNMYGYVNVNTTENQTEYVYKFRGRKVFKVPDGDCNFFIVDRIYEDNKYEHGYMYFDNSFRNVVIITKERTIIAADEEFINQVKELQ